MSELQKLLDGPRTRPVMAAGVLPEAIPVECGRLDARWYAVQFNPEDQRLVRPAIHRLGFSTFLPLVRIAVPDRRVGKRIVKVPAFAGYLFVEWGPAAVWQRILTRPGVAGILRPVGDPKGQPIAVPAGYMANLQSRTSDGGVIEDVSVAPVQAPIERDTLVRLTDGPFAGHIGLCGMSSAERVTVLLTIMGCERNVTARRRYVEPV